MTTGGDRNIDKTYDSMIEKKNSTFPTNMAEEMEKADKVNDRATRGDADKEAGDIPFK